MGLLSCAPPLPPQGAQPAPSWRRLTCHYQRPRAAAVQRKQIRPACQASCVWNKRAPAAISPPGLRTVPRQESRRIVAWSCRRVVGLGPSKVKGDQAYVFVGGLRLPRGEPVQQGAFGAEEGQRRPRVAAPIEHANVVQLELLNFLERLGAVSRSSSVRQAQVHAAVEVVEEPSPSSRARSPSRFTRDASGDGNVHGLRAWEANPQRTRSNSVGLPRCSCLASSAARKAKCSSNATFPRFDSTWRPTRSLSHDGRGIEPADGALIGRGAVVGSLEESVAAARRRLATGWGLGVTTARKRTGRGVTNSETPNFSNGRIPAAARSMSTRTSFFSRAKLHVGSKPPSTPW